MIILSEISGTEKDKYHTISLIGRIEEWIQMNFLTKQKETHRPRKETYGYQKGKWGGEGEKYTHYYI